MNTHIKSFQRFLILENNSKFARNIFKRVSHLSKKDEYKYIQAFLNYVHDEWQSRNMSYTDILEWVEKNLGEKYKLFILLVKYNYQVGNGGHEQYHDNRYSEHHDEMIHLMEKYKLNESELGKKVFEIMKQFDVDQSSCNSCGGDGYEMEWDEETEEEYRADCWDCGGRGDSNRTEVVNGNALDNEYYEIDDRWLNEIETIFERMIFSEVGTENKKLYKDAIKYKFL